MKSSYQRHDISDRIWSVLEPLLPGRASEWGSVAKMASAGIKKITNPTFGFVLI